MKGINMNVMNLLTQLHNEIVDLYNENTHLQEKITALEQENKELREWKEANKPTGICETCTEKANQTLDTIRKLINT